MTGFLTAIALIRRSRLAQGLAAGAAVLVLLLALNQCAKHFAKAAFEAGHSAQQASDLRETITRTERANNAAETIRRDADARFTDCLRHARNPHDC